MPLSPTEDIFAARTVLREAAVPATERRLKISPAALEHLAADGVAQCLQVLGPIEPEHAGWALLMSGIRIARSTDTLAPPAGRRRSDSSFGIGLMWAGLVSAVAGDRLIQGADDMPSDAEWEPGEDAQDARQFAQELGESLLDSISTPEQGEQFTTDSLTELDKELVGLDHAAAGWMLCTFGVWIASGVGGVATPLVRRGNRMFRRVNKPKRANDGCRLVGALLAQTGVALLDHDVEATRAT